MGGGTLCVTERASGKQERFDSRRLRPFAHGQTRPGAVIQSFSDKGVRTPGVYYKITDRS